MATKFDLAHLMGCVRPLSLSCVSALKLPVKFEGHNCLQGAYLSRDVSRLEILSIPPGNRGTNYQCICRTSCVTKHFDRNLITYHLSLYYSDGMWEAELIPF